MEAMTAIRLALYVGERVFELISDWSKPDLPPITFEQARAAADRVINEVSADIAKWDRRLASSYEKHHGNGAE